VDVTRSLAGLSVAACGLLECLLDILLVSTYLSFSVRRVIFFMNYL